MKKGQFYTFAGVMLISLVYIVLSSKPSAEMSDVSRMQKYITNYDYEAHVVINNAIFESKNISEELINFTTEYIEYGKSKDLNLGILFLYSYERRLHIVNYLNAPVYIEETGDTVEIGDEKETSFMNSSSITYLNKTYSFQFSHPDELIFKTLFSEGDTNQ